MKSWKVDLHTHTRYSRDCLTDPARFIAECRRKGLDKVAVTEHNNLQGALHLHEMAPDLIIVGEEIKTTHGEFIAYFVQEETPKGLHPQETLDRLRAQRAVISISHPLDSFRGSAMGLENTLAFIDQVDALEVFNARCLYGEDNERALDLARRYDKLFTAGSDAHTLWEIGRGYMLMPPFHGPQSFKESLAQGRPGGTLSGLWIHFASTYAKLRKRRRHASAAGRPK